MPCFLYDAARPVVLYAPPDATASTPLQERIEAAVVNDEFVRDYDGAKEAQERLRKLKAKLLKEQSELGDEYLHKLVSGDAVFPAARHPRMLAA